MKLGLFSVADAYPGEIERDAGQFYQELLSQAQLADQLDFDSFWVAEHHFHHYGVIPRAAIWLAAASQRTTRIRLGAAVVVLPFDNPLRTAEDYAMLDQLTNGRLNIGVGSGYLQHEFSGFQIAFGEKRDRFNEALEIMQKAWTGKVFSYEGKFQSIKNVAINVTPVQAPGPPLAVAILNTEAARFVGATGADLLLIPYATVENSAELKKIVDAYLQGRVSGGFSQTGGKIYCALHAYCSTDSEQARKHASPYFDRYVSTRLYARQRPYDQLHDSGLLAIGNPQYIADLLINYESMGVTHVLAIANFGGLAYADVCDSITQLASVSS